MSKKSKMKKANRTKIFFIVLLVDIFVCGIFYYALFPALNIHNREFWDLLIILFTADLFVLGLAQLQDLSKKKVTVKDALHQLGKDAVVVLFVDVAIIVVVAVGSIAGWKLFRAKSYASLLKVETKDFDEDIPESDSVTNIALMDTESARIFGNREVGSLADVVSQYEVETDYTQINYKSAPLKVAALRYASFFKWLKNRDSGVPGYVKVNPVNSDASYQKLNTGMKYVPSGWFNDNLMRHVQLRYPTKIVSDYYFEIDEEGNPYYICPCITAKIGLFNGYDVDGAIICDPITGDCNYYAVKDIPNWVDRVYDGDLCTTKYDWYGILSGGYWNSVISQTKCTRTTDDYGYIALDDDIWVYTGVTSLNNDSSNVGFVMINQRTSEARYYVVSGAEEYSAMQSAEGTVQEKNYEASFPCLINVKGQPTYMMVLKDSGGLVKMYAMVNVEQYNIVSTGKNQAEVFKEYKKQMRSEGIKVEAGDTATEEEEPAEEINGTSVTFVISDIQYILVDGETVVYLKAPTGKVYKQAFLDNENLITLNIGDRVTIYTEDDVNADIIDMSGFKVIQRNVSGI